METRNISVSLDKAKEWYDSDNITLKELALQAFKEEELRPNYYTNIRTFRDAVKALDLNWDKVNERMNSFSNKHVKAIYKLDLIRRALNRFWRPSMTKDIIYYPIVRIYKTGVEAETAVIKNKWTMGNSFTTNGEKFTIVCGDSYEAGNGLTNFSLGNSVVSPLMGLLGCSCKEVAKHMSKYFSTEIFEATYVQYYNYSWIDQK